MGVGNRLPATRAKPSIATRATSSQRETNPRSRPSCPCLGEMSPILVTKNKNRLINHWKKWKEIATRHQAVFKKLAEIKKSAPSDSVGFQKNHSNSVKFGKKSIEIHLIKNVNSEIPNRRIPADFVDKLIEFTDKLAE
jgi:hypothetical protein